MNVGVFGVGCIGGLLAARLGQSGCRVRLFDRPERLDALRRHGLTVTWMDGSRTTHTDFQFGHESGAVVPDVLFIALKAYQIAPALAELQALCSPATTVVTVQNGIPWWYFMGDAQAPAAAQGRIETLDPDGAIERAFAPAQLVGCIAYPAAAAVSDVHIRHVEGERMPVGAVSRAGEDRAAAVQAMLETAGFKSRLLDDLRGEIWLKAVGTASLNPISALTRSTFAEICADEHGTRLARAVMSEAAAVAKTLGITLRVSIERRLDGARRVGHHRSSMLQDLERGEPLETDALVTAIIELGERTAVDVPHLKGIRAMLGLLESPAGA